MYDIFEQLVTWHIAQDAREEPFVLGHVKGRYPKRLHGRLWSAVSAKPSATSPWKQVIFAKVGEALSVGEFEGSVWDELSSAGDTSIGFARNLDPQEGVDVRRAGVQ